MVANLDWVDLVLGYAWAVGSYSRGPPAWELPKSRSTKPTGLFTVSVIIQHPYITLLDGPILKPFGVLIAITIRFCLVYDNVGEVGNNPSEICHEVCTDFGTF